MQPTEIADTLDQQLLGKDLLELQDDRPLLTAKGRRVVVCGSPTLWNS